MKRHQDELSHLQAMVRLREHEVDHLQREVNSKRRLQERYHRNIERMNELCEQSGASAATSDWALALNCASYKSSLLQLMASQQQHLALCNADMAVSWQALCNAALRREVMVNVRDDVANKLNTEQGRREQKQVDDFAGQAWWRSRAGV